MQKLISNGTHMVLVTGVLLFLVVNLLEIKQSFKPESTNFGNKSTETIHVATAVCTSKGNTKQREDAAIFIKSVIISAKLHAISRITFHILVEHVEDANYLWYKLKEYGHPFRNLEVNLFSYEVGLLIPSKYHPLVFHPQHRCAYAKYFLPKILNQLDSVIYFDTTFMLLGNIAKYWDILKEMNTGQMVGVTGVNEQRCYNRSAYSKEIPHLKTTRLHTQMLVMNLTKMREFDFEQKFIRIFTDYSILLQKKLKEEKVFNIFMFYSTITMKLIPCKYNFWAGFCDAGVTCCPEVQLDKEALLGISGGFRETKLIQEIAQFFDKMNLKNIKTKELETLGGFFDRIPSNLLF